MGVRYVAFPSVVCLADERSTLKKTHEIARFRARGPVAGSIDVTLIPSVAPRGLCPTQTAVRVAYGCDRTEDLSCARRTRGAGVR